MSEIEEGDEAWYSNHAELEDDECDTCGDRGKVQQSKKGGLRRYKPCPDCTDESDNTMSVDHDDERWVQQESEGYDEPKRREKPDDIRTIRWRRTPSEVKDYIHDLQSEISDCWENQQEYKNDVAELHRQNERLRERIEEAREQLQYGNDGRTEEILSPDSDEGDGCEEKHA